MGKILVAAMTFRSEKIRRAVAAMPCAYCGREGRSQAAHSNLSSHGKCMGKKASDAAIFPLCADELGMHGCHYMFDQHKLFPSKAAEFEGTYRFIAQTLIKLIESGELKV